jgi:radical SAM superfamily enzyme YgiQ (UPF0313 family)
MQINFRWSPKNRYSIAALGAVLEDYRLVRRPEDGVMLYSFASPQAAEVYQEVDMATSDSIFIAGGPHPSGCPEEAAGHFDFVVVGEGEETLPELLDTIRSNGDATGIKGIAFMRDGRYHYTGERKETDLDRHPPFRPPLYGPIEISRGCPWSCAYCHGEVA